MEKAAWAKERRIERVVQPVFWICSNTGAYWSGEVTTAQTAVGPTTAKKTTGTTRGTASTAGETAVSDYMLSRSTRLTVVPETDEIVIDGTFTLELLTRSLAFREGYAMAVADAAGAAVTDTAAAVESGYTVTVADPAGVTVRTFTVKAKTAEEAVPTTSTSVTSQTTVSVATDESPAAPRNGSWWVWVVAAAVLLAGGGTAVYFLLKKRQ